MEFKANTVLVTGGGSGIGFALAERFIQAGSSVITLFQKTSPMLPSPML
jgi:uncharacterized oxidoreductase